MAKLAYLHSVVYGVLNRFPDTRGDDFRLYCRVCEEVGANLSVPAHEAFMYHDFYRYPSFETVTRCRRRIQKEYPDLCDAEAKKRREEKIDQYKEYAKQ